jgi:hypothetical protein
MDFGRQWMGMMGKIYPEMAKVTILIILALLVSPGQGTETKTAYTRDDIHFASKERVEENIKYEYARPGDYKEVQVPLDTVVIGASSIPENISLPEEKKEPPAEINLSSESDNAIPASASNKYPYASLSIGLLIIGGLVFFLASVFSGHNRR